MPDGSVFVVHFVQRYEDWSPFYNLSTVGVGKGNLGCHDGVFNIIQRRVGIIHCVFRRE